VLSAGVASFVLDFFSPVCPQDYARQSMPFSYLTISASSLDNKAHSIQIYSDVDNSWTGQFGENVQTHWNYDLSASSTQIFGLTPGGTAKFSEVDDMAQWGTAVYCTRPSSSTVHPSLGDLAAMHSSFVANGSLLEDWSWKPGSVVAFSHDLGPVVSAHNVTFTIGYVRDTDVNYMNEPRVGYWHSTVSDIINAASVRALLDFPAADAEGRTLDAAIASGATAAGGRGYNDIVSLSVRQVFGAFDVTIPQDTLDINDIMVFVKEISSNGNANTIDVILPISPILYVLAPEYICLLLEPVMQYLQTGAWSHNYTASTYFTLRWRVQIC